MHPKDSLVGGWTNPFEKYARQIGSWNPRDRGENKTCLKPPPRYTLEIYTPVSLYLVLHFTNRSDLKIFPYIYIYAYFTDPRYPPSYIKFFKVPGLQQTRTKPLPHRGTSIRPLEVIAGVPTRKPLGFIALLSPGMVFLKTSFFAGEHGWVLDVCCLLLAPSPFLGRRLNSPVFAWTPGETSVFFGGGYVRRR